jgi:hypothetical protein
MWLNCINFYYFVQLGQTINWFDLHRNTEELLNFGKKYERNLFDLGLQIRKKWTRVLYFSYTQVLL